MRTTFAALVIGMFVTACGNGGTYVFVNVESGAPLSVTSLDVTITNAGSTGHASFSKGGPAFDLPQSFYLSLDANRTGDATIEVIAYGSSGELARGSAHGEIASGKTTSLNILLGAESPDAGNSADVGGDMAPTPDLGEAPIFMAARNYPAGSDPIATVVG